MSGGVLKYGGASNESANEAAANFISGGINGLSLCTTPLELLSNDGQDSVLHRATGFFWNHNGKPHLVTNYHVASGRNPFTGEIMSDRGFIPRRIRYHGMAMNVVDGIVNFSRKNWIIEFNDDVDNILAKPPVVRDKIVDLWTIPILPGSVFGADPSRTGVKGGETASCFVNEHLGSRIATSVGDDCFILGYPLANYEGLMLPIWKRGSLASETMIGIGEHPMFLIDAATTPSMSGSPIFRKVTTFTANNQDIGALQEFSSFEFIGVYAGRLQSAELLATNMGYGWYRSLIDGLFDHYKYGTWTPQIGTTRST